MQSVNLGVLAILITLLGYTSNRINWRYLNYKAIHFLYYIGAAVHETSHAIVCLLTGAKIEEYAVFSRQPRVVYRKPKLPLLGNPLISFAPIVGGLFFLYLVNRLALGSYFYVPAVGSWNDIFLGLVRIFSELNPLDWRSWVMVFLFFNVGAMIGPSFRDLKNIWPFVIILFFIKSNLLASLGLLAVTLILADILIQIISVFLIWAFNFKK